MPSVYGQIKKKLGLKKKELTDDDKLKLLKADLEGNLVEEVSALHGPERGELLKLRNDALGLTLKKDLPGAERKVTDLKKRLDGIREDAAKLKKLSVQLQSTMVEEVGKLRSPVREPMVALFNQANTLAQAGDLKGAEDKVAELKKQLSGIKGDPSISNPFQPVDETTQFEKELSFKTDDLVPKLNKPLKRIKLDGTLFIELKVTLRGESYKQNEKNDLFAADIKKIANGWFGEDVDEIVAKMVEVLKDVDGTAMDQEQVQTAFEKAATAYGAMLSIKLQAKIEEYIKSNKAIKEAYRKYQIGCVHDVAMDVIVIVASIGSTAASWGATGPVAVVAIVRSCVGLGVKIHDMAIDEGQLMTEIDFYFNCLKSVMEEIDQNKDDAKWTKALNSAKEIGIGALNGITKLPFPSVAQVGKKMKLLDSKLQGIHTERQELGKKMAKLRNKIEEYEKKIDENKNSNAIDKEQLEQHKGKVKEFAKQRQDIEKSTEDMYQAVLKAVVRQTEKGGYNDQLATLKKCQAKFARSSETVFGFLTDAGLSAGAGSSALESGLGVLNAALSAAEAMVKDKALG